MTLLPLGAKTTLPASALFNLDTGVGQWIEVRDGAVWITQPAEPRDIVLEAGDSYMFDDPREVIVSAIGGPAVVWADSDHDRALAA